MISDEDYDFLQEVGELEGSEFGEYINSILEIYRDGYVSCAMSDVFKKALEDEIESLCITAKTSIEIEGYEETVTRVIKGRRLKDIG